MREARLEGDTVRFHSRDMLQQAKLLDQEMGGWWTVHEVGGLEGGESKKHEGTSWY